MRSLRKPNEPRISEPCDETKSPSSDQNYININHGDSLIADVRRCIWSAEKVFVTRPEISQIPLGAIAISSIWSIGSILTFCVGGIQAFIVSLGAISVCWYLIAKMRLKLLRPISQINFTLVDLAVCLVFVVILYGLLAAPVTSTPHPRKRPTSIENTAAAGISRTAFEQQARLPARLWR